MSPILYCEARAKLRKISSTSFRTDEPATVVSQACAPCAYRSLRITRDARPYRAVWCAACAQRRRATPARGESGRGYGPRSALRRDSACMESVLIEPTVLPGITRVRSERCSPTTSRVCAWAGSLGRAGEPRARARWRRWLAAATQARSSGALLGFCFARAPAQSPAGGLSAGVTRSGQ